MLGNVLVNGVVGETGEGVSDFVDVDFGFFGSGRFREAKNGGYDAAKFALGEKFSGFGARFVRGVL